MPEDVDVRLSVAWVPALILTPWTLVTVALLIKYLRLIQLAQRFPDRLPALERAMWGDELFFILFSMTAVGFVTVLVWESVFPDQRDAQILSSLPVRGRTVVFAKLSALMLFLGAFAVAMSVPTGAGYAFAVSGLYLYAAPAYLLTHLAVVPLAGLFVVVSLIALQITLAAVLPQRLLRGISIAAQLLAVIALIEMLVYLPVISGWLGRYAQTLTDSGSSSWLPPLWFLGLYETLLGSDLESFRRLAVAAPVGIVTMSVLGAAAYAAGYRRIIRRALESPQRAAREPGRVADVIHRVWTWTVRDPTEQAVIAFVGKSLARSGLHRLVLAIYVGVAFALVLGGIVRPVTSGLAVVLDEPTVMLLSIPLILSFFTLVGLRVLFAVPVEVGANWVFQMTELDEKTAYLRSTRKALVLLGLVPIGLITFPLYWALWGLRLAAGHTALWMLLGTLLIEALLARFRKVPFTCSYMPGNARVKRLWPVYLALMLIYGYTTAQSELWLLAAPHRWLGATGILAIGLVAARASGSASTPSPPLTYVETDDDAVQQLGLSRMV